MITIGFHVLIVAGVLLCLFGLRMAHFFFAFPAIPGFLTVSFWEYAIAFGAIAVAGVLLAGFALVRVLRTLERP